MRLSRYVMLVVAFLFPLTALSGVAAPAPWVGFEDVPPSNIFYDDIAWLAQEGITRGCNPPTNTRFCPTDPVSRGQMAAFLTRALELPEQAVADWFEDDDESVFENDIDRLAAAGITAGCNPPANTHFCPDAPVTRAQMASFLVRALELETGAGVDWFNDDDESVHEANVDRLRAAWITFGCNPPTENNYCPNQSVTRQQMAAFLHRALTQPQPGAAIGVHGYIATDPLYMFADMVAIFEVKNTGSVPLTDVTGGPYTPEGEDYAWGDCFDPKYISGPAERIGNGDAVLDPAEIWDWYCGMPLAHDMGGIYLEANGMANGSEVSTWAEIWYTTVDPINMTLSASASSVSIGQDVTWTINLRNLAPVQFGEVWVEARKNGSGGITEYRVPAMELEGNGDTAMDPGEVWQYEHTETLWTDTYLQVVSNYVPVVNPFGMTGYQALDSAVITVRGAAPPSPPG